VGLRRRCTALAVARVHALVVEVPGWWATRVAVEQELARRGWVTALSPADADALVVCGEPGERLAAVVDRVWDQLPGPRARVVVRGDDVGAALDDAGGQLVDEDRQRADARSRRDPVDGEPGGGDHGDMDHDTDMAPAGIPLAGGDEDRDGLEMDVLRVPLGPVLPHWPAGLVLRCTLHGDVVAEAEVDVLAGRGLPPPPVASVLRARDAAAACDGGAGLLAVAGWGDAAAAARRVRDLLLAGPADRDEAVRRLDRLRSRVARSWSLRRLVRGLGPLDGDALSAYGLRPEMRGDVHDRLVALLDRARAVACADAVEPRSDPDTVLAVLPGVVAGLELGAVRLVVASLAPDTAGAVRQDHSRA
jgi:hypothetical protein